MAFRPAIIERTTKVGTDPLAYYVRVNAKQKKDGTPLPKKRHLILRIVAPLARKCGFKKGDAMRLDLDPEARQGRLLTVERSSRHLSQACAGRSFYFTIPYTGELPQCFSRVPTVEGLAVLQTSLAEGLIFELPKLKNSPQ